MTDSAVSVILLSKWVTSRYVFQPIIRIDNIPLRVGCKRYTRYRYVLL